MDSPTPSTSKDKSYKKQRAKIYCFVPNCPSNSVKFPHKLFLTVPKEPELRKKWVKITRKPHLPSPTSVLRCCEDHFDLENDVENWLKFKLVGGKLILKKDVVPHIFDCQQRMQTSKPRSVVLKRKRQEILQSIENEHARELESPSCVNNEQDIPENVETSKDQCIQVAIYPRKRSKAVQVSTRTPTNNAAVSSKKDKATCSLCHDTIPASAPLYRCVQCTGRALLCASCQPAAHAHRRHCLIRMPSTAVHDILERLFHQLRLDTNELLSKATEDWGQLDEPETSLDQTEITLDEQRTALDDPELFEKPCLSGTRQHDPLDTVVKEEFPKSLIRETDTFPRTEYDTRDSKLHYEHKLVVDILNIKEECDDYELEENISHRAPAQLECKRVSLTKGKRGPNRERPTKRVAVASKSCGKTPMRLGKPSMRLGVARMRLGKSSMRLGNQSLRTGDALASPQYSTAEIKIEPMSPHEPGWDVETDEDSVYGIS